MALKTTLASCLVLSLFVLQETTVSLEACDAFVDLTVLIDSSGELTPDDYRDQKRFSFKLINRLLPSQNEVHMRFRFYTNRILEYYSGYGGYEDKKRLMSTMFLPSQLLGEYGDDVIQALSAASRLEPETACRKRRGARRIVVAPADGMEKAPYTPNPKAFRNMMEERGVDVLVLAVGNSSTLNLLDNHLDLKGSDRIIKLDNFQQLLNQDVIDEVVDELCKVTPEMASYRNKLSASFRANYSYNGHSYYLSREYFHNLTQVYDTCSSAGGHLAIMDDQQEYDAMKQYFIDKNPGYGVFIDGTDAHKEGVWTLLSGAPLPFVDWLENHPRNTADINCLVWSFRRHAMFDELCYGLPFCYPYLFLCEVSKTCDA